MTWLIRAARPVCTMSGTQPRVRPSVKVKPCTKTVQPGAALGWHARYVAAITPADGPYGLTMTTCPRADGAIIMVTVVPGLTAIGYLYPGWGVGPAPLGSTDIRALMMYSDPTTRSRCPGAETFGIDALPQESSRGLPGLPTLVAVPFDCLVGGCDPAVEQPAVKAAAMASATMPNPAVLCTVSSLHPGPPRCRIPASSSRPCSRYTS